jgi:hypothetical protein
LNGVIAWLLWSIAHVYFLIGFCNRVAVALTWGWSYLTFQRGTRLITGISGSRIEDVSPPSRAKPPIANSRESPMPARFHVATQTAPALQPPYASLEPTLELPSNNR